MTDVRRRPGPTVRLRVEESHEEHTRGREDRVITEEPLEIRLAWPGHPAQRVWVTMRTPGHDFELAAGYAVHEGLTRPTDINNVAYCTDATLEAEQEFNVVTLTLSAPPRQDPAERHGGFGGGSACGVCGKDSIAAVFDTPRAASWEADLPSVQVVRDLPEVLRQEQSLFALTGGVHAAGLFSAAGEPLVVREDVGRHNAVDKVTGSRALRGLPTAEACLVVSGRAGFELVQKAVAAGIGSLVAVGAPSSLGVRLATEAGLTLYGFTSTQRCVRYA
jgi:FdhD protein